MESETKTALEAANELIAQEKEKLKKVAAEDLEKVLKDWEERHNCRLTINFKPELK